MSDKATLLRLLREHREATSVEKASIVEDEIVGLFDAVRDEMQARIVELEAAQRWVPVGESLPKYSELVLTLKDGKIYDEFVMGADYWMPRPNLPIQR